MSKVTKFEIVNHGYDHAQYFRGCCVYGTTFSHCATGAGFSAKEAYEDAVNMIADQYDTDVLPTRPRGIRASDHVPRRDWRHENNELYWYVSIRYSVSED